MDHETRTELDHLKISTQRDLHRLWELLMQPLGFRSTSVWVTLIGADDRPERFLIEIAQSELLPEADQVRSLFEALQQIIAEEGADLGVAFLITRPGPRRRQRVRPRADPGADHGGTRRGRRMPPGARRQRRHHPGRGARRPRCVSGGRRARWQAPW